MPVWLRACFMLKWTTNIKQVASKRAFQQVMDLYQGLLLSFDRTKKRRQAAQKNRVLYYSEVIERLVSM